MIALLDHELGKENILRFKVDQHLIHLSLDLFAQGSLSLGSHEVLGMPGAKSGEERIPELGLLLFIFPVRLLLIALQVDGDLEVSGLSRVRQVYQEGLHLVDVPA